MPKKILTEEPNPFEVDAVLAWAYLRAWDSEDPAVRAQAGAMQTEYDAWDRLGMIVDTGTTESIDAILAVARLAKSEDELYFVGASLGEPFSWAGGDVIELLRRTAARAPELSEALRAYLA